MYQAIYRRYRPKTFDELIGQDDLKNVLKNQVDQHKTSHAYLFTGTRGTGKTSAAKIMARAVNCLDPKDGNPCNECKNCRAILEETTMDFVEMDAASNRRIDDIRELKDQVIFPPATLKYKVYIIDEAHMITNEGFNALLKIMEEPPKHLIFILATTEIEKIPQTILSRCQRFDFKRISQEDIKKSINMITKDLGVEIEDKAVDLIARAADGALRDAQSLLDQVLATGKTKIKEEDVISSIGGMSLDYSFSLVNAIGERNESEIVSLGEKFLKESGADELVRALTSHYKNLILAKAAPQLMEGLSKEELSSFKAQAADFDLSELADSVEILLEAESQLRSSSQAGAVAILSLLNLARLDNRNNLYARIEKLERQLKKVEQEGILKPVCKRGSYRPGQLEEAQAEKSEIESEPASVMPGEEKTFEASKEDLRAGLEDKKNENPVSANESGLDLFEEWEIMVDEIIRQKPSWALWLRDFRPERLEENRLILSIEESEDTKIHQAKTNLEELTYEINTYLGSSHELGLESRKEKVDKETSEEEERIRKLKELFQDKLIIK